MLDQERVTATPTLTATSQRPRAGSPGLSYNQFGGQEPRIDEGIRDFCSTQYDVTFPVFGKIDVNWPTADSLFVHLPTQALPD